MIAERCSRRSPVFRARALFDVHVFEFAGLEDLAAFFALDEFRILIATDNLDARVLAGWLHVCAWAGGSRRL